jgi:uncharacterized protein (DUF736 family)
MTEYDNTNRGVLFPNNKEKNTQPDYKGNINVDGTEFWLSGWKKMTKDGNALLSLSIQPKEDRPVSKDTVIEDISDEPISLEDIPF